MRRATPAAAHPKQHALNRIRPGKHTCLNSSPCAREDEPSLQRIHGEEGTTRLNKVVQINVMALPTAFSSHPSHSSLRPLGWTRVICRSGRPPAGAPPHPARPARLQLPPWGRAQVGARRAPRCIRGAPLRPAQGAGCAGRGGARSTPFPARDHFAGGARSGHGLQAPRRWLCEATRLGRPASPAPAHQQQPSSLRRSQRRAPTAIPPCDPAL